MTNEHAPPLTAEGGTAPHRESAANVPPYTVTAEEIAAMLRRQAPALKGKQAAIKNLYNQTDKET